MLDGAQKTFERMPERDVVSWTTIILAYGQAKCEDVAFKLFGVMLSNRRFPPSFSACASLGTTKSLGNKFMR